MKEGKGQTQVERAWLGIEEGAVEKAGQATRYVGSDVATTAVAIAVAMAVAMPAAATVGAIRREMGNRHNDGPPPWWGHHHGTSCPSWTA